MAATAYPHMIFATGPDVITKELLHEVLAEAYPHGAVTDAPLKSVLTLGDYAFSFWFDDEAEGLAERYAGYLPEGARRRRLIACTTMIDFSGAPDPDQAHRADADRIVSELAELDGVWVFSEESKRFVAFDYGEPPLVETVPAEVETPTAAPEPGLEPAPEPALEPAAEPAPSWEPPAVPGPGAEPAPAASYEPAQSTYEPAQSTYEPAQPSYEPAQPSYEPARPAYEPATSAYEPAAAHEPAPVPDLPIEPSVESQWAPPDQAGPAPTPAVPAPERTVPLPGEASQPRPELPQPTPPAPYGAPGWPGERAAGPQDDEEKTGFFKRVFKRKNP